MLASAVAEHGLAAEPLQPSGVVVFTRAILPPTAAMLIGVASVTSGAGSAAPTAPPEASWTRTYWPGAIDPASGVMNCAALPKVPVPLALAYWIDQPARLTVAAPRLKSSTKSFPSCAPVFPPPP